MAEVTVRWTQRVLGRAPGEVETVESTPLIEACILQGRAEVVSGSVPDQPATPSWNGLGPIPDQGQPVVVAKPEPAPIAETVVEPLVLQTPMAKAIKVAQAEVIAEVHPSEGNDGSAVPSE